MANTEQIEAKLCAYVDGELDAAGRAEIEQHLAANPQHRVLLEELQAQRHWLRDLPREKAPEDLIDTFQAQMERSVLLDGGRPHVAGRINPWPQVIALAAVLVLAVGLASVIYFVLPDQSKRTNYAVMPATSAPAEHTDRLLSANKTLVDAVTAPTTPAAPAVSASPSARSPGVVTLGPAPATIAPRSAVNGGALAMKMAAPAPAASPAPGGSPTTLALAGKQSNDIFATNSQSNFKGEGKVAASSKVGATMFEQLPLEPEIQRSVSLNCPDNSMVMVVASANPTATDKEVTGYLAQNNIRWDDVTEPMPAPVAGLKDAGFASKLQSPQMQMSRNPQTVTGDLQKQAAEEADKSKVAEGETRAKKEADVPAAAPTSQATQVSENAVAQSAAAQPTTRPSVAAESITGQQDVPAAQAQQTSQPAQQQVAVDSLTLQKQMQNGATPRTRLIVARNLTQDQVSQLNDYACNNGKVSNYRRNGSELTPTTVPSNGFIAFNTAAQNGQSQQGFQQQVGGGGGAFALNDQTRAQTRELKAVRDEAAATTQPTTNVSRSDIAVANSSGSVSPRLEPTTEKVARVAMPTTQPAIAQPAIQRSPTSEPAIALGAPSTQAVAAQTVISGGALSLTTAPSEDRVDVVIVVKADAGDQAGQPMQIVLPGISNGADIPTTAGTNVMQNPAPAAQPTTQLQQKARVSP